VCTCSRCFLFLACARGCFLCALAFLSCTSLVIHACISNHFASLTLSVLLHSILVLSALEALKLEVHQVKESLPVSHLMKALTPSQASVDKATTLQFFQRLSLNAKPIEYTSADGRYRFPPSEYFVQSAESADSGWVLT
jgi:hypothetical protein